MNKTDLTISWIEFDKFKHKIQDNNSILAIWDNIKGSMSEDLLKKLPNELPELEVDPTVVPKANEDRIFAIPYIFKFENLCSCTGINEFLEKFIIYIYW